MHTHTSSNLRTHSIKRRNLPLLYVYFIHSSRFELTASLDVSSLVSVFLSITSSLPFSLSLSSSLSISPTFCLSYSPSFLLSSFSLRIGISEAHIRGYEMYTIGMVSHLVEDGEWVVKSYFMLTIYTFFSFSSHCFSHSCNRCISYSLIRSSNEN